MNRILTILTAILTMGSVFAKDAIVFADSLENANVTIPNIIDGQSEGLLIGNGDMYGLIYPDGGRLHLRITKNDIWDARVDTSENGDLPRVDISKGTVSGWYSRRSGPGTHKAPPGYRLPYPQPLIGAALHLGEKGSTKILSGHLDIGKGVAVVKSDGKNETALRVLGDCNVLLIRSPFQNIEIHVPDGEKGSTDGIEWIKRTLPGDIDYKGMTYALAMASKGDLKAVSLVTSFDTRGEDVVRHAVDLARKVIAQDEEALVRAHEEAWARHWSKSGVQLGDRKMEQWWYRLLYFAKTICKPGAAPVGLMPPLATDDTPWHADFHHNYNAWQAFWALPAANHPDLVDPWISYNHSMIPRYKDLARETFGIGGLHVPISSYLHEPDPSVCKSRNKRHTNMNPWGLTIGLQAMTLQAMWQKYLIDQDVAYMKEKIYPFAREVATFYVEFMSKCKKDDKGKILLGPSYSPEHGEWGIYNCPFDIAYVSYAFDAFMEAAQTFGEDAELVAKARNYKALLGDYPTNAKGIVVDWQGCEGIEEHNLTVPAVPVFPAERVSWFSPQGEKDLFMRTIENTRHNPNNSNVIFNVAKARLSMADAYSAGRKWFASRELPNGFFVWTGHGHGTYMSEMIGIVGMINEFLLQSVENKIRIFPCWPQDKDARFSGLRAQGGFIVSAEYKDGRVTSATIESTAGKPLVFLSPWDSILVDGETAGIDAAGLVTLPTKSGEKFVFTEATRN